MNKIKVLHVLHCVGGVEVSLRLIIANLNTHIFENIIVHGLSDVNTDFTDKDNNKIKSYKIPIYREISFINDIKSIWELYKIIKAEKPNILHVHSAKGGIIGRLVGKFFKIKVLFTPQAFSYLSEPVSIKRKVFLLIEKIFSNSNSILLASSNSELERGISEVGYKKNKALLFNNCINPIISIPQLSILKTWPDEYICTVGRPSYQKNIELMIQIINELKKKRNIHLIIMGVGHYSSNLEGVKKLISDFDLKSNVTLIEWTSRENIFHIISKSKLYISTARYEGLPYSIIEALSLSKPCVVSDCDGNRDLIENGYNGYVIKNENKIEFAKIIYILLNDNALLEQFSQNAFESFSKNYNIISNISILEKIYNKYSIK